MAPIYAIVAKNEKELLEFAKKRGLKIVSLENETDVNSTETEKNNSCRTPSGRCFCLCHNSADRLRQQRAAKFPRRCNTGKQGRSSAGYAIGKGRNVERHLHYHPGNRRPFHCRRRLFRLCQ